MTNKSTVELSKESAQALSEDSTGEDVIIEYDHDKGLLTIKVFDRVECIDYVISDPKEAAVLSDFFCNAAHYMMEKAREVLKGGGMQ